MRPRSVHFRRFQIVIIVAMVLGLSSAVTRSNQLYSAQLQIPPAQGGTNTFYLPLVMGSNAIVTANSQVPPTSAKDAVTAAELNGEGTLDDAILPAAESYVEKYKVSLEEAISRIKLQTEIGALNAKLQKDESASLAGLWIEHEPEYKVVVQFTDDSEATLALYLDEVSFAQLIEVRTAPISVQQLENIQQQILDKIKAKESSTETTIQADLAVNVQQNRIDIFVTDPNAVDWPDLLGDDSQYAAVVKVNALPVPESDIRAGYFFDNDSCTIGWNVTYNGDRYASTAYHCSAIVYSGNTLTTRSGWYGSGADLEIFYKPSGYSLPNRWQQGYSSNVVTIERGKSDTSIGTWLCHIGADTNWQCGTVTNLNYTWGSQGSGWVTINYYSCAGDSGGPVLVDVQAFGMHVGGPPSCGAGTRVYMPLDAFWSRGVHVATSP